MASLCACVPVELLLQLSALATSVLIVLFWAASPEKHAAAGYAEEVCQH